jgi:quercetin dioxygenase-like cupin family protein
MDDLRRDQTPSVAPQIDDDDLGGDSACWAHLFEDEPGLSLNTTADPADSNVAVGPDPHAAQATLDLVGLAQSFQGRGPASSLRSDDLDLNLLVFAAGEGVAEHQNTVVDVLVIAVIGEGIVTVEGQAHPLAQGQLILIPKGKRRSIRAVSERFAYLSCHRRRPGLLPTLRQPATPPD